MQNTENFFLAKIWYLENIVLEQKGIHTLGDLIDKIQRFHLVCGGSYSWIYNLLRKSGYEGYCKETDERFEDCELKYDSSGNLHIFFKNEGELLSLSQRTPRYQKPK